LSDYVYDEALKLLCSSSEGFRIEELVDACHEAIEDAVEMLAELEVFGVRPGAGSDYVVESVVTPDGVVYAAGERGAGRITGVLNLPRRQQ